MTEQTTPVSAPLAEPSEAGPDLTAHLRWYRAIAYTVGVGLIVLVFVGIPLQVWGHDSTVEAIVGTAHGWLYMAYLVAAFLLARKANWSIGRTIVIALAGTIPIGSFVCERYVTRWARTGT